VSGGGEGIDLTGRYVRFRRDLPLEARIAALAQRQHWVLSLRQLQSAGLTRDAVRKRAATGRLHRIHRGVYAVGRRELTARGRWMAATLAYGPGALLSHDSAAELSGIHRSAQPRFTSPFPAETPGPGLASKFTEAPRSPRPTSHVSTGSPARAWPAPSSTSATTSSAVTSSEPSTRRRCFVSSISAPYRMPSAGRAAAGVRACCVRCSPTTRGRRWPAWTGGALFGALPRRLGADP
jgi:hypothetical protein